MANRNNNLRMAIHKDDLKNYDNKTLAKMYNVSLRTIARARKDTGIKKKPRKVYFTEKQFRENSRKELARKLDCPEYYITKYAKSRGWRKK